MLLITDKTAAITQGEQGAAIDIAIAQVGILCISYHTSSIVSSACCDVDQSDVIKVGVQSIAEESLISLVMKPTSMSSAKTQNNTVLIGLAKMMTHTHQSIVVMFMN